jgi:hypothetical protein
MATTDEIIYAAVQTTMEDKLRWGVLTGLVTHTTESDGISDTGQGGSSRVVAVTVIPTRTG